ncbi:MAG TPA: ferritin-like domain-containing protein [Clostridia bacterium]|jgi:rubrerythrin|nr:ferritin-like domain-containing protein [Clostridia bacterium]
MEDKQLIKGLNKILTFEHGHLGMYKNFLDYEDKEIRRVFRRFMEVEIEHINKISTIIRNLGSTPSPLVESGDIIGKLFGITINFANIKDVLKAFSFIEKKSQQGYANFIAELEQNGDKRNDFIAELAAPNMLEAQLMHLWLEDKLKNISSSQN